MKKFGRRNFLKGLASASAAAAAWMVKPKLPKLEDPPEEENDDVEQTFYDDQLWPKDCGHCWEHKCSENCPNKKDIERVRVMMDWPISCSACHFYACHRDCPRHAISPYRGFFTYGDTFRSLEEQQERRARLKENVRRWAEENE